MKDLFISKVKGKSKLVVKLHATYFKRFSTQECHKSSVLDIAGMACPLDTPQSLNLLPYCYVK